MSVFGHLEFFEHQQICFFNDAESGLKAIVAIHNTNRGPALGGCRMWPYASEADALSDVLRLSKGMTYKSALANLNLGGGKSVIIGDPRKDKSEQLLRAMGRCLHQLGGRYIAAEDSGISVEDVSIMGLETPYVAGMTDRLDRNGNIKNGDPSPATAYGVFVGLSAAVKYKLDRSDLAGLKVGVQGVGNVGYRLTKYLIEAGAQVYVSDIHQDQVNRAVENLGAKAVSAEEIMYLDLDVFAPCALGAVVNDFSIDKLNAKIIAGAANNQLGKAYHGDMLKQRGILYAPDYVINAGGIIDIGLDRMGMDATSIHDRLNCIGSTLTEIFTRAAKENLSTAAVADQMAEERFTLNNRALKETVDVVM